MDHSRLPVSELAHLVTGGTVCYENGGLPLDLYDPGGSVLRVLEESVCALERSFGGKAAAEFERELASYWRGSRIYIAIPRQPEPTIVRGDLTPLSGAADSALVAIPHGAWQDTLRERRAPVTILRHLYRAAPGSAHRNCGRDPSDALGLRNANLIQALGAGHQDAALKRWRESEHTMDWVGEWHSHPESVPSPSSTDLHSWQGIVRDRAAPMVFLIVGYSARWVGLALPGESAPQRYFEAETSPAGIAFTCR